MKPVSKTQKKTGRIGVLVANLGTPDSYDYWSMRRYLDEFLSDRRVIDLPRWKWLPILKLIILTRRPFTSGAAYKSIWNEDRDESPLMTITRAQTDALRVDLEAEYGDQVSVAFSMRYGNPSTAKEVGKLVDAGCDKVLFFPLYPQYAGATTATANDAFFAALATIPNQPTTRTIGPYYANPRYIDALACSIEAEYSRAGKTPDILVVSYHGMPERYVTQGDPYYQQCLETTELLRARLGWADDTIVSAFQSRFGPEEWLKPYTVEEVARQARAGNKNIAVIAPAFSADCIETLEEINEEIQDAFLNAGGEKFTYIPCLNAEDAHIRVLAGLVRENLLGWV